MWKYRFEPAELGGPVSNNVGMWGHSVFGLVVYTHLFPSRVWPPRGADSDRMGGGGARLLWWIAFVLYRSVSFFWTKTSASIRLLHAWYSSTCGLGNLLEIYWRKKERLAAGVCRCEMLWRKFEACVPRKFPSPENSGSLHRHDCVVGTQQYIHTYTPQ